MKNPSIGSNTETFAVVPGSLEKCLRKSLADDTREGKVKEFSELKMLNVDDSLFEKIF